MMMRRPIYALFESPSQSQRSGGPEPKPERLRKSPARKRPFFEFSLCLSRACLGKMLVFIYKWLKKWRFSHLREFA
jgi:hypothetical protein